jgi:hypothetical protein
VTKGNGVAKNEVIWSDKQITWESDEDHEKKNNWMTSVNS